MIICICHRVSDRDIARAARDGCTSFDDLQLELAVGTACGKCGDCARETFVRLRLSHAECAPSPPPSPPPATPWLPLATPSKVRHGVSQAVDA